MQGIQRYVVFTFLALGILAWATFARLFSAIFFAAGVTDTVILGSNFTLSTLIGMITGVVGAWVAYRRPQVYEFTSEVVAELKKVTWPSKKETQTATVVVIITSVVMAFIMGVFDQIWAEATGIIYK
ncbi:MAG: preprotein translocase subunit SecE [Deltaproteobacteria bacterium]|nr:preprotein translocase subunit SecE [Deltaproteobacteria bacterium]